MASRRIHSETGTRAHVCAMSALPPKADIAGVECDVRYVPIADISANLFCQLQRGHRAEAVALQIKLPIERVEFRQLSD